jgi:hypothetical protein
VPEEEASQAPAEETPQDTPAPTDETPQEDTSAEQTETESESPDVDWQERYNNLQPEYTRATQEAAQYRQIIEAARQGDPQALELLGYQVDGDEDEGDDDEYVDPDERINQLEQKLTEREQAEQEEALQWAEQQWLKENVDSLLEKENAQLTEHERNLLVSHATANRFEDGQPDIEGAFKLLKEANEAATKRYLESKKAPSVPVGSAGSKKFDLNDDDDRRAAMELEMERAMAEES